MTKSLSSIAPLLCRNISSLVKQHADRSPNSVAIVTPDEEWSYSKLELQIARYTHLLSDHGIHAGDRLAFIISDERVLLTALLAAARLAAPVMLIPRSSTTSQKNLWMSSAGVRYLVSDIEGDILVTPCSPEVIDANLVTTDKPLTIKSNQFESDIEPHLSILILVVGSGTTGKQKLMPITHAQMQSRAYRLCEGLEITSQDRLASLSHLEYAGGIHRLFCALMVGASFVLLDKVRHEWRQWHKRYGLTILSATVFHTQQMLKELRESGHSGIRPLDGVKLSLSSSVVTQELRKTILTELSANFRVIYGTNEAWTVSIAEPTDLLRYPGTVGCILPGVMIKIVDEQLNVLPSGQTGLIAIRSDQVIEGYLNDEQATQIAFRDGWFIPGDLGYMTHGDQLIFCGRSDNMMIFNGINIFPIEIEQCLLSHPDVVDIIAFPTRHVIHQDIPVAIVVLKKNASSTEQQLINFAADYLGPKQPRRIVITSSIPRNQAGKPIKEELIKILSQALTKTDHQSELTQGPRMKVSFRPRSAEESQKLAVWTRVILAEDAANAEDKRQQESYGNNAQRWLQSVLDFAVALLQSARIPVFNKIRVIDCQPSPDKSKLWVGACQFPDFNILPRQNLLDLLRETFILAEWSCGVEVASQNQRQELFKRIETTIFSTLASAMPQGKSTFEVLRVANRLSIPYRPLPGGLFQLGWGSNARKIHRSTTDQDSALAMFLTRDKFMTAQMLRQVALPAPVHSKAMSLAQAQEFAEKIGYPVVVKPSDMERGEGVTVDVAEDGLAASFKIAQEKSPSKTVLIERQVPGVCHRLFITKGQLLYAVKRLPIGVYGDGISSISELVEAAYDAQMQRPPWMRSGVQSLNLLQIEILHNQGWIPQDVVPEGTFVALRRIESTAWGGVDEDVTSTVHPENVNAAIRATRLLGLEVAGVDIISQDITQAWYTNDAVINEVNYAPLLGGGEISRNHIQEFLSRILKDNGKIPITIFIGADEGWTKGAAHWKQLLAKGVKAYLTNANRTLDAQGRPYVMAAQNLDDRVRILLMDIDVEALVIVARSEQEGHLIRELCE